MENLSQQGEPSTIEIVTKLSVLDIDPALGEKLKQEDKPQLQELGQLVVDPQGTSMVEYDARVARAREAIGLEPTTAEPEIRSKFKWRKGDVVNLHDLFEQVAVGEEVQFTDYRGRI